MLKEFVEKIVSLAAPTTFEVDGKTYASKPLNLIKEDPPAPGRLSVNGLDSVCKLIRNEAVKIGRQIFIQAEDYRTVNVFTTYGEKFDRYELYCCYADTPRISTGSYKDYESAVVELRSLYIPNSGTEYLLKLLSSISSESKVTTTDNGVTQKVEAKSGIALKEVVAVEPRVSLKPFRTFLEVPQPESEFLLRISQSGTIGLFEADGGVWKLEATRNIAAYFEEALKDMIEAGQVVVIR